MEEEIKELKHRIEVLSGVVFILLNVILKGPINKLLSKFVSRMNESGLMEH